MEKKIKLTISSSLENVPLLASAVNKLCSFIPLSGVESYQVEVCIVEAVNNAIKHAYENKPGYDVEVVFTLHPDKLILDICDFGRAMEQRNKPYLDFDPNDLKNLPEEGIGLFIIETIMDDVSYRSDEGKNTLTMTKFFNPKKRSGDF